MTSPVDRGRLDHIDAMRAIAVLLVMWTHYAEMFAPIAGSQFALYALQRWADFGRVGVVIFFGVSGMLIPTSLRGTPRDGSRRFLIRRFLRLYPAFWLSLPIGYLAYWTLFGTQMNMSSLIANVTMIPSAFGKIPVMGHYWTLETELYFYGLCLILFWLGALHRMRDLCLVSVGLCLVFVITSALKLLPSDALGQYKGMLYHLAIMFWGACFRQAYDTPLERVTFRWARGARSQVSVTYRVALVGVTALIAVIALLMAAIDWRHNDVAHMSVAFGYLLGIAAFALFSTVLKVHLRVFAWLGEISYSIYLLHGVPLYVIVWLCRHYGLVGGPLGLYMVATVPPAIVLSWASYKLVEAPGIRLAHALTSRRDATAHGRAALVASGDSN
ncbi:acyltransferase family protein [Paraburkholderia phytofirmans]|uniref:acyltransferase family protein n=1 Tax=Paraburkholderia phytofirmans TaxID=261302 RepID=UPI0038B7E357